MSHWDFLTRQFVTADAAERFAASAGWDRVTEPEQLDEFPPKGKLPFEGCDVWLNDDECYPVASWSIFILPVPAGILNRMTGNEIWAFGADERELVELLSQKFGDNPLDRIERNDFRLWVWGEGLEAKPNCREIMRLALDKNGDGKISLIHMFMN